MTPRRRPTPAPALETLDSLVNLALAEDIGMGDITTQNTLPAQATFTGDFLVKEAGVIAGLAVARRVFARLDPGVTFQELIPDGTRVKPGDIAVTVSGSGRALLSGERVALNFMQRMSGIATATRRYVDAVAGTSAVILDTRKTAPGLRLLDKWAVRLGGGQNHRTGLYDMALIKDNHIAAVGSISEAVRRVRAGTPPGFPIEVEVTTLAQLREALALPVDRILLDNMTPALMAEAVALTDRRIPLEASGGISLETVAAVAASGVDYISIGALTHSVRALDISLDLRAADA